jgi:hypothetical protein
MENNIYEEILNNDSFLNDLFTSEEATTRVSILEKAGFNLEEEYKKWSGKIQQKETLPL